MSVILYLSGEAKLPQLSDSQKKEILSIKKWEDPIFSIDGDTLEYAYDYFESLDPFNDYVIKPLYKVLKITKDIKGLFFVTCDDDRDFDNIAVFIENGELVYRNAAIINATTEELEEELERRRRNA